MEKNYLVVGAAGSIGRQVTEQLLNAGHRVIALVREHQLGGETVAGLRTRKTTIHALDVNERCEVTAFADQLKLYGTSLDGVIYAVGHCPPGGFAEAIAYPLSQLPLETYQREIGMHQIGALNVFQELLPFLAQGGCFVFLSSAITRLENFPPFLHAYHYASAISAGGWLIRGMRCDPAVSERGIKIHRIAPAAVDTPFHSTGPKPPKLIPVSVVADEVVYALEADKHTDKEIV